LLRSLSLLSGIAFSLSHSIHHGTPDCRGKPTPVSRERAETVLDVREKLGKYRE